MGTGLARSGVPWPDDGAIGACTGIAAETRILTLRGEVAAAALRPGDLMVPAGGGAAPPARVAWVGRRSINVARHRRPAQVAPVRIAAGALADGVPRRDLLVAPGHALLVAGRLVPAVLLVNGRSITQEAGWDSAAYVQVELPAHGLLLAEGAWIESYVDHDDRRHFGDARLLSRLDRLLSARGNGRYDAGACLPVLRDGPSLLPLRARLAARAEAIAAPSHEFA